MSKQKVMLVGWDAADWKVIQPLMDAGKMPNVQRLVENGSMAQIATLNPPLSPMLWTSIATGKRPFKHGILGFSEPTHDGRSVQPVTNLSRKSKAIWNIFEQTGLRSIVVGWWPSYPAEPISGVMVSDQYHRASGALGKGWPLRRGAVHPERLAETMAELRLHPEELAPIMMEQFIPDAAQIDQTKDGRLLSMSRTLCECVSIHSAATWLLDNEPWDFFAVYFDAIDHFCHAFMKYHPPRQSWISDEDFARYSGVVSKAYELHDQMLGTLIRKAGDNVRVILMSDHGFHPDHLRPRAIPDIPAGPAIEHRDFGILAICGHGIRKDELLHGASILDIAPTLLAMYGLPVGEDMDGKVLSAAFEVPPAIQSIPSWEEVPGEDGRHPAGTRIDPVASREAMEQLVALGYVEPLDENAEVAVAKTVQELNYNLCESLQDAARHAEALDLARELRRHDPDEQRFAVKAFVSCQALGLIEEMRSIVHDLEGRRKDLFLSAQTRWEEFRLLAEERFKQRMASEGGTPGEEEIAAAVRTALWGERKAALQPQPSEPPAEPLFSREECAELAAVRNLNRFQPAVVQYLKAQVLTADRKWFDALACLAAVEAAHLVRPGLLLQAGDLYGKLNRWDEAERTYFKALQLDPDNPHAHLGLCRVALRRRNYEEAAQSALDCLQRLYQYPMAHFLLGVSLTGLRHYARAAEAFRAATRLNPNFPQAHVRLAWLLKRKLNDPAAAAEEMRLYRETRRPKTDNKTAQPEPAAPTSQTSTIVPHASLETALPPVGDVIVVVCGLPRSGTSMIMQMLAAGGMPVLTDEKRAADEDNPLGYFEFDPVRKGRDYREWIDQAAGKAIKVVAPLIGALPATPAGYRVILIERDPAEILASQAKMIGRRSAQNKARLLEDSPDRRQRLRIEYERVIRNAKTYLTASPNARLLQLRHSEVMRDPATAARQINLFCGGKLRETDMAACVRPDLHRQRGV